MEFDQEYSVPLVMHPRDPNVLYSSLAHGQPRQWRRATGAESVIIRTADGGRSWSKLDAGEELSRGFVEAFAMDPRNPDRMFGALRSGEMILSEDGGNSWQKLEVTVPSLSNMKCVSA
jgi:photosystem II stability/assembly factor-like uncharacterized protein